MFTQSEVACDFFWIGCNHCNPSCDCAQRIFFICFDIFPFLTYPVSLVSIGQVRGELPRRPWAQVFDVQSAEGQHAMEVR